MLSSRPFELNFKTGFSLCIKCVDKQEVSDRDATSKIEFVAATIFGFLMPHGGKTNYANGVQVKKLFRRFSLIPAPGR